MNRRFRPTLPMPLWMLVPSCIAIVILWATAILYPFQTSPDGQRQWEFYTFDLYKWEWTTDPVVVRDERIEEDKARWQPLSDPEEIDQLRHHDMIWLRRALPSLVDATGGAQLTFKNWPTFEAYVNGEQMLREHQTRSSASGYSNTVLTLPYPSGGDMLYMQVRPDPGSPPIGQVQGGSREDSIITMLKWDSVRLVLAVCYFFMLLLAMLAWLLYERNVLYWRFCWLALAAGYSALTGTTVIIMTLGLPQLTYYAGIGNSLVTWALAGILEQLSQDRYQKSWRRLRQLFLALILLSSICSLVHPGLYELVAQYTLILVLLIAPYLLLSVYRMFANRKLEARWLAGGLLFLLLAIAYNRLTYAYPFVNRWLAVHLPNWLYDLSEQIVLIALFVLVFTIGMVLVLRAKAKMQQYTATLLQQNDRLQHLDQLKDEFLANTSHELRTPLHGMIGLSESLLSGSGGSLAPAAQEQLTLIVSSGRRLSSLIDDLLDLSKLNHADLELQLAPIAVYDTVAVVLAVFKSIAEPKGLALINEAEAELPRIMADANRLQQILFNLIGNAVKFTDKGSITVRTKQAANGIAISVLDTGIGIPSARLEKLGIPFEQAGNAAGRGGTGLGLSITRQLVELHGGKLTIESEEGVGTVCSFTLPLCPASALSTAADDTPESAMPSLRQKQTAAADKMVQDENEERTAGEGEAPIGLYPNERHDVSDNSDTGDQTEPLSILIVDDEPVNLQVLEGYLAALPLKIRKASTGAAALEAIAASRPELVLLDVMLPDMNGYEVCRSIRITYSIHELPVILLTARNRLTDLLNGFESGANDYLTKPTARHELLARVQLQLKLLSLTNRLEQLVQQRTFDLEQTTLKLKASIQERAEAHAKMSVMQERTRISQDIHDNVGHTLTASIVQLEAAIMLLERGNALGVEKARLAQSLVRTGLDEIRESVRLIRYEDVEFPLQAAMEQLLEHTSETLKFAYESRIEDLPALNASQKHALYQALKEGLTNGIRHGQATRFRLQLLVEEGALQFRLWNNGKAVSEVHAGFGIQAMKDRIHELGGKLNLVSEGKEGCTLQIELPI